MAVPLLKGIFDFILRHGLGRFAPAGATKGLCPLDSHGL